MTINKQLAVQVAEDVKSRIGSTELFPSHGCYFSLPLSSNLHNEDKRTIIGSLQSLIQKEREIARKYSVCVVCALGALFYSHVVLHNQFDITRELETDGCFDSDDVDTTINLGKDNIIPKLLDIFDEETLDRIENFFENYPSLNLQETEKIRDFAHKFKRSTDRLTAICDNIIDNGGEFTLHE